MSENRKPTPTGTVYYMPAPIGLTGVNGETQIATTKDANESVNIIGGMCDLNYSFGKVTDLRSVGLWSDDQVPLLTMFGMSGSARPLLYYKRPLPLMAGARLRAEVLNLTGETGGHLVYVGLLQSEAKNVPALLNPQDNGEMYIIPVNSKFSGVLNQRTTTETNPEDRDVVVWGAFTNLGEALIRITGADGRQWMNDPTPVWAVCGKRFGVTPILYWPRPYALPRQRTLKFEFLNVGELQAGVLTPEASGQIYLIAQKLK
jgi:hypothetical protein